MGCRNGFQSQNHLSRVLGESDGQPARNYREDRMDSLLAKRVKDAS